MRQAVAAYAGPITKCPPYKTTTRSPGPEAGCGGHDGMLTAGASSAPAHQSVRLFFPAFYQDHGMYRYRKRYSSQESSKSSHLSYGANKNHAEERNKKRRVADVRFSFRVAHLLLPAVRTNPKRNLPHLALGGCTRASSPIPTRGPFSLGESHRSVPPTALLRRESLFGKSVSCALASAINASACAANTASATAFTWALSMWAIVNPWFCSSFSIAFRARNFASVITSPGSKPSARNDASSAGLSQTNAIREPLLQCSAAPSLE